MAVLSNQLYNVLQEFIDESTASMSSTTTSTSNSSPVPKKDLEGSNSRSGSRLNHNSSSSPFHQGSFRSSSPQPPGLAADLQANGDQQQPRNVIHIVTKDFPQYFAIVSRPRQDIATVGPEGAILASLRVPKAQVYHKPKYAFTFFIVTSCVSILTVLENPYKCLTQKLTSM